MTFQQQQRWQRDQLPSCRHRSRERRQPTQRPRGNAASWRARQTSAGIRPMKAAVAGQHRESWHASTQTAPVTAHAAAAVAGPTCGAGRAGHKRCKATRPSANPGKPTHCWRRSTRYWSDQPAANIAGSWIRRWAAAAIASGGRTVSPATRRWSSTLARRATVRMIAGIAATAATMGDKAAPPANSSSAPPELPARDYNGRLINGAPASSSAATSARCQESPASSQASGCRGRSAATPGSDQRHRAQRA